MQLAAESNARAELERELKKMKGEVAPTRRSKREKRGALQPVVAPEGPAAANLLPETNVEEQVKEASTTQKENRPVRRSMRQVRASLKVMCTDCFCDSKRQLQVLPLQQQRWTQQYKLAATILKNANNSEYNA